MPGHKYKKMSYQDMERAKNRIQAHRNRTVRTYILKVYDFWQKIALEVWLIGQQHQSNEAHTGAHGLKLDVIEAIGHFKKLYPDMKDHVISRDHWLTLNLRCILTPELSDDLNANFQAVIRHIGESVAGDEKLFYFAGESGWVRLIINKPGKLGLWFYELVGMTQGGHPFLLHTKLHRNDDGTKISVASMVREWIDVCTS